MSRWYASSSTSSDPEELPDEDVNGLEEKSDELPEPAWVVELLKHPTWKQSATSTIEIAAFRAIMITLQSTRDDISPATRSSRDEFKRSARAGAG